MTLTESRENQGIPYTLSVEEVTPKSFPNLFEDRPDLKDRYEALPQEKKLYTLVTTSQPKSFEALLSSQTSFTDALRQQHRIKYPSDVVVELPLHAGARRMRVDVRQEIFKYAKPEEKYGEPTGNVDEYVNRYLALQIGLDKAIVLGPKQKISNLEELIHYCKEHDISFDFEALRKGFVYVVLRPSVIDFEQRKGLLKAREPFYRVSAEWIADLSLRQTQAHPERFIQPFIFDSSRELPLPDYITYIAGMFGRYLNRISKAEFLKGFDLDGANKSLENLKAYVDNIIKNEMVSRIGVSNGARADMDFRQLMELANKKGMRDVNRAAIQSFDDFTLYLPVLEGYLETINNRYKDKDLTIKPKKSYS